MHRILLISDNETESKRIRTALRAKGYNISTVSLKDALDAAKTPHPLDILLIEILTEAQIPSIRNLKKDIAFENMPAIGLVKQGFLQNIDFSLNLNDFICAPYSVEEIEFRIRLVLWRLNKVDITDGIKAGDLTIDFAKYEVRFKGKIVDMAYKEYELLKFLATHPDKVLTRELLLDKVWGYNYYGGTRTVDVHIRHLRSKIEDEKHTYIETVRNVGYRFVGEYFEH